MSTPAADKPNVTDAVTITDTPTVLVRYLVPTGTDALTIGEVPTVLITRLVPTATDALTIGEAATPNLQSFVAPTDALTIGETPTVLITILVPVVTDAIMIGEELIPVVKTSFFVTESVSMMMVDLIAATEALTLSETTAFTIPLPSSVTDGLSIGDDPALNVQIQVTVTDSATAGDDITIAIGSGTGVRFNITEATITVSDVAIMYRFDGVVFVSLSEGIHLDERAVGKIPPPPPRVYVVPQYYKHR